MRNQLTHPIVVLLIVLNVLVLDIGLLVIAPQKRQELHQTLPPQSPFTPTQPVQPPKQVNPQISVKIPGFLTYSQILSQMEQWATEAPELVELGQYGVSSGGIPLHYLRMTRLNSQQPKKKVLVMACIHGNEPLATSTVLGYMGTLLDRYGDEERITELLDARDIYFVPVVSPDTFPRDTSGSGMRRHVDGVDPNRNFPTESDPSRLSVAPIRAIQDLFKKIGFHAAISGHTWGRVFLKPWGDSTSLCPHDADYQRILGVMSDLSGYRNIPACQVYGRPIYGTEVDWFYRQGAMSIVIEYGKHQNVPSMSDVQREFDMTYEAVVYFLEQAPIVR